MKQLSMQPTKNKSAKIINMVIWGGVVAGVIYLLYRRTDAYKQRKLDNLVKQYPGWEINNGKKSTPTFMYAKPFKAFKADGNLDFEAWLIFYNTGVVKIFTRGQKEELILKLTEGERQRLVEREKYLIEQRDGFIQDLREEVLNR